MEFKEEEIDSTKKLHTAKWSRLHNLLKKKASEKEDERGLEKIDVSTNSRVMSILRHSEKDCNLSSGRKTWKGNHSKMSTPFSDPVPRRASIQQSEASSDQKTGRYKIQPFWGITATSTNFQSTSGDTLGDGRGVIRSVGDLLPCLRVSQGCIVKLRSFVHSKPWRIAVLFFEGVLLFGPPTRDWWCPKRSDGVFDVLFGVTIAVLFVDIVLMSYAIPKYFSFYNRLRPEKDRQTRTIVQSGNNSSVCGRCCSCTRFRVGGFIFWFDVISALTLLFDMTSVNTTLTEYKSRHIYVDSMGKMVRLSSIYSEVVFFALYQNEY